jgi:transposase
MRTWRRQRAFALKEAGWEQQRIAEALGVTEGAVSQWMQMVRAGGPHALAAKPRVGKASKLTAAQKAQIVPLLEQGAEAHGYAGQVWTLARVADLILRHFDVRYHNATMSDLLREVGWTSQQPRQRASQRNEEAIAQWQAETWPTLKKKR